MNGWLDANADGIALFLWVFAVIGAALLVGIVSEWTKIRAMRLRRRHREAYQRYCAAIDAQARRLAEGCWRGPEARS